MVIPAIKIWTWGWGNDLMGKKKILLQKQETL